jgi:hypothetical protein
MDRLGLKLFHNSVLDRTEEFEAEKKIKRKEEVMNSKAGAERYFPSEVVPSRKGCATLYRCNMALHSGAIFKTDWKERAAINGGEKKEK